MCAKREEDNNKKKRAHWSPTQSSLLAVRFIKLATYNLRFILSKRWHYLVLVLLRANSSMLGKFEQSAKEKQVYTYFSSFSHLIDPPFPLWQMVHHTRQT